VEIEWVAIPAGTFMMGSNSGDADEMPVHQVDVPAFDIAKTEVTVAQYQACVDAGVCTEPADFTVSSYCIWGHVGTKDHPVNCMLWFEAIDFCTWVGGRLPSEAEWEYAARGGGQDIIYPWGDDMPTCDYAVMDVDEDWNNGNEGCGQNSIWPVCSKTAGNTAQGLCDMAGNVYEWVQDWYHSDYNGAPTDGSAWEIPSGSDRVARGGCFVDAVDLRASDRDHVNPSNIYYSTGCRCAR
jgi:formylglycine-generating enzyme required for sulfatase activity